ncbi:GAF and ANTAR domain-containing protein [Streptomyces sp. SAS_270]|uniref:GAF and ANTAR domain-containing protein n=1 Tax=Streptomyces sp. SAS_270 TaxID=3412748 RepID=UPI00403C21B8
MRPEHSDHRDDQIDGGEPTEEQDHRRITGALSAASADVDARLVPEALCRACVGLVPVTGASVSLSGGGVMRATWCASDDTSGQLAEAQYTLGDGPCQSALDLGVPVLAPDLTGRDARRWPLFAQQAVGMGARAVFSLPLGIGGMAIGTLDLYRDTTGSLSDRALRIALLVRDAVTFAVLNLQTEHDVVEQVAGDGVASWVEASQADHTEVHQAVGMVMVQLDADPQQALDRMRARAFAQGRSVSQVAHDVVARKLRFWPETQGRRSRDDYPHRGGREGLDGER